LRGIRLIFISIIIDSIDHFGKQFFIKDTILLSEFLQKSAGEQSVVVNITALYYLAAGIYNCCIFFFYSCIAGLLQSAGPPIIPLYGKFRE